MLPYPQIDPVFLELGPLKVRWYGLMYLCGFAIAWGLGVWRIRRWQTDWTSEQFSDLLFYVAIGLLLGGRVGYMLFYDFPTLLNNPLQFFKVWQGGMSFHGGLLGVIAAVGCFAYRTERPFWGVIDFVAPLVPPGLGFGRLGNFINGEVWGRVTDVPWAMVFPNAGPLPRHPSQLYECFFEGVVLFIVLWWFSNRRPPRMAISGLFLLGYGIVRFMVEFVRQPDWQLGFIWGGWLTMGQLLSLPMIILGAGLMLLAYQRRADTLSP